jgi:membrane-associated phospholipid phosphatase
VSTSSIEAPPERSPRSRPTRRGLALAARRLLGPIILVVGLLIVFVVSGWVVPPYLFILALALPLIGIVLVTGREDRLTWTAYILGFVVFAYLRAVADATPIPVAYDYVIAADRWLGGGVVPTVALQNRFYTLGSPSTWDYYTLLTHFTYFFVPHLFAFALWTHNRGLFRRYVVAALVTYYAALLACILLPTAPPWLAGQTGALPHVFRVAEDVYGGVSAEAYDYAYAVAGTNAVAAMPSLHQAIATLIALATMRVHPLAAVLGWGYAVTMGLALVYTGEHYVVDLLAGVALAWGAWRLMKTPAFKTHSCEDSSRTSDAGSGGSNTVRTM